jgi:hypothetical protein
VHLNNKINRYVITAAATIFTLAIMSALVMATAPAAATTSATTTTTPSSAAAPSSSALELSPQPIYQEVSRQVGENLINDTHVETTFTANGTLNLPNGTEPISTTSTGSILVSFVDSTAIGKQVINTEDGSESATAKFFGIARFNMEEGTGRGIVIAVVQTNSTGMLAPLNGMILAGQGEFSPEGTSTTTLWEWQSGIPLPTGAATTTMEVPPQMNTTTTTMTTNATTSTVADTNAITTVEPEEEEGVGEQQQQQTTPTTPPNPLFE